MGGSRTTYLIVGLFVVAMLAGATFALVRLSGWTVENDPYFTAFRNVSGIKPGTLVVYEGYPIGQVTGISRLSRPEVNALRLNPQRTWFRVDFQVEEGWRIPRTGTATISASGFLAAPSVSIVESPDAAGSRLDRLEVGGFVPGQEQGSIFAQAESLAGTFQTFALAAQETLENRVNPTIDEARALIGQLSSGLDPVIRETGALVASLQDSAAEIRTLVGPANRERAEELIDNLNTAARDVRQLTRSLTRAATQIEALVAANREDVDQAVLSLRFFLDTLARDINAINRNLEAASRNMNEFSRRIRQNPGLLLGGAQPRVDGPGSPGR